MIVKLLTEHHLEFLSLKGDYRGSSESTHVKMPHCWKSHITAHLAVYNHEILILILQTINKGHDDPAQFRSFTRTSTAHISRTI